MDAVYGLSLTGSAIKRQTNKTNKITERQNNRAEWAQKRLAGVRSDLHTTAGAEVISGESHIHERKSTSVVGQDILQRKDAYMGSMISKEQRAISNNNFALLQELIEKNNNNLTRNDLCFTYKGKFVKTSLLGYACRCENLSAVKYLISQQVNINAMDAEGYTPLHRAISNSKIVKYLLKHGADPKIVSDNSYSVNALGAALMTRHAQIDESLRQTKIAKALLKFDNELLSRHCYKTFYPLETAIQLKFLSIVPTIIERYRKEKIDIPVGNMHLYSLLHSTCASGKLTDVKYQVHHKKKELSKYEFTSYINQIYQGRTPFHLACNNENKDIIKYLLKNGADIYQLDFNGLTPLEILLKNSSTIEYFKLIIDEIPKKDLDKPLFNGFSALSLAIKYSNNDLSYLLISKRADLHRKHLDSKSSCLESSAPVTDTAVTITSKKVTFGYVERLDLETGQQLDSIKLI